MYRQSNVWLCNLQLIMQRMTIYKELHCTLKHMIELNPVVFRVTAWPNVQFMKSHGNRAAKDVYEKFVPVFYYQPQQDDCE